MASMNDSLGHVSMSQVPDVLRVELLVFNMEHTSASRPVTSTPDTTACQYPQLFRNKSQTHPTEPSKIPCIKLSSCLGWL